ncbi:hypothetical protein PILCRDRAFT_15284 [Piloderma croceum F 1598]|uniref:Uncharacterized protein n=1 Tax=Piloderma croceum (strain F 1598) TaxID=765440 RepID=A0A0C3B7U7_PILCF|nr:hypothetical protein PILCRDRAFT_15284 [Piloderma croceum F 1598]
MISSEALLTEEIVDIDSTEDEDEDDEGTTSKALLKFPEEPAVVDVNSTGDDDEGETTYFNLPSSLMQLRKELLQGYSTPAECPDMVSAPEELTPSEMLTLKHYIAWKKSNGTVHAYKLHAEVLQSTNVAEILSLGSAKKLTATLTDFKPQQIDMCPQSCIAYTGEFADMKSCPYIHAGKLCGELHYLPKKNPMHETNLEHR